jgi:steroid delta-isomerase-like uncharacterized protein
MSLDVNKAIARRFYEGYNTGDLDTMFALIAPDVVWHGPSDQPLTREQWKQIDATLVSAFSTLSITIEDQIAEADRVVTRTTLQGSHQGEFQGLAPTGKRVTMRAINIDRIVDGQVVEHWVASYSPSLLQQLTAPTPSQSSGQ